MPETNLKLKLPMKNISIIFIASLFFVLTVQAQENTEVASFIDKAKVFLESAKLDSAEYYSFQSLEMAKVTKSPSLEAESYTCLANIYEKKRDDKNTLKYLYLADKAFEEYNSDATAQIDNKKRKAKIYTKTSKGYDALNELNAALKVAEKANLPNQTLAINQLKVETLAISNRFKDAYKLQSQILATKDSLFNKNKNQEIAAIDEKYKAAEKQVAVASSKAEKIEATLLEKEAAESTVKYKQWATNAGIALAGILGVIFMVFRNLLLRRQKNKLIDEKNTLIADKKEWKASEKMYLEQSEKFLNIKNSELHRRNKYLENKLKNNDSQEAVESINSITIAGNNLNADKIIYISADPKKATDKIVLMENNETIALSINKTELMVSLPSNLFQQANGSQIINLTQIKKRKANKVQMSNDDEIGIDEQYQSKISKKSTS